MAAQQKYLVFYKETHTDTTVAVSLLPQLQPGESVVAVQLGVINPVTTPPLELLLLTPQTDAVPQVRIQGGVSNTSYGFAVLAQTSFGRNLSQTCAILVKDEAAEINPFTVQNPDAFQDLVGTIMAGESAVGTGIFAFTNELMPTGGSVTWDLLAENGTVWASGNAFSYEVRSTGFSNTVYAKAVINVPTNVPPTLEGQKYQIRWTLDLSVPTPLGSSALPQQFFAFEQITVVGLNSIPLGTQPSVELQGSIADLSLVTEELYDTVTVSIYYQNRLVAGPLEVATPTTPVDSGPQRVATGWLYQVMVDTTNIAVTDLEPFTAIWRYSNSQYSSNVYSEHADFWVINPSISQAINDLKATINKAQTTLYGRPDLLYPPNAVLTYLRRGRDMFNGYKGYFTSFTMINAVGPIREYWLLCSSLLAIEAQLGGEIEKSFEFQGQAIELRVDRTAALEAWMGRIQQRLDNELPNVKTQLINKGNTGGDGSQDPSQLQPGAMGGVGLTLTVKAMSNWPVPGFGGNPPFAIRR